MKKKKQCAEFITLGHSNGANEAAEIKSCDLKRIER